MDWNYSRIGGRRLMDVRHGHLGPEPSTQRAAARAASKGSDC